MAVIDINNYQRKISPNGRGSFLDSKNDCGNRCRATVDLFGRKSGSFAMKFLRHFRLPGHRFYTGNVYMAGHTKQGHRKAGAAAQYTGTGRTGSAFRMGSAFRAGSADRTDAAPRAHRTRPATGTLAPGPAGMIYTSNDLI